MPTSKDERARFPHGEEIGPCLLLHADCRNVLLTLDPVDAMVADPPYSVTSLTWDKEIAGWLEQATSVIKPEGSAWVFGSLRSIVAVCNEFQGLGWTLAQDVIWEKHNGSGFHADRFKRVHEIAVQFYRGRWNAVWKSPVYTADATKRTVRRKERPPHMGEIEDSTYVSEDGGPRLMRSVIQARSCHGHAEHPTQKPTDILRPLIEYSCPPGGVVLDPTMGSGSTLVACVETGRRAIGIETDRGHFETACRRVRQAIRSERSRLPLTG